MKKSVLFLLSLTVSLFVLASCSDKGSGSVGSAVSGDTLVEIEELEGSLISATPKTFTIFSGFNNMPFNAEWPVWKEVAKKTNIHLEGTLSQSSSNEDEAFNLMISSGKLPDIISFGRGSDLEKLGRDGGLIPLNNLIKNYAPNIQKMLDEDPAFRQVATALDGNIYTIPKNFELVSAEFYWIRKDWLDMFGLEVPTTVDELYEVLTAFRNGDPNGNGIKDEIPLFDRTGPNMPDEYLSLFDSSTTFYPRDGVITFEPLEKENFVYGVNELAKWYREGLIDPEILTRGAKSRDVLFSGNLGGFTHDWPSTGNYNSSLASSIPGFKNIAIAPPVDQNGNQIERTIRYPSPGWSISSQSKDPVTIIRFFDYFFTEEGSALMNWGIEGETYTVNQDGEKEFTPLVLERSDMTPLAYLRSIGAQYRVGMNQDAKYEYAFMAPESKEAASLYDSNPQWYRPNTPILGGNISLKYTAEDEVEYKRLLSQIEPYVDEMFQKWLLGTSSIDDDYDKFVAEIKKRGIDRAIEINQKAYDTYLGK